MSQSSGQVTSINGSFNPNTHHHDETSSLLIENSRTNHRSVDNRRLGTENSVSDDNDNTDDNKNELTTDAPITYVQLLVGNSNFRYSWLAYVANHTVRDV